MLEPAGASSIAKVSRKSVRLDGLDPQISTFPPALSPIVRSIAKSLERGMGMGTKN